MPIIIKSFSSSVFKARQVFFITVQLYVCNTTAGICYCQKFNNVPPFIISQLNLHFHFMKGAQTLKAVGGGGSTNQYAMFKISF